MDNFLEPARDNRGRMRLEIDLGDGETAFAAYQLSPGALRFHHTVVPEGHGGKGIGTALVRAAIALARESGLKIVPVCPFVRAYFRKHPDEMGIVQASHRHLVED